MAKLLELHSLYTLRSQQNQSTFGQWTEQLT